MRKETLKPYLIRLAIITAISFVFVVAFNEVSYFIQKDNYDRAPETVQLVIPLGTAEKVEAGENDPTIPEEMVFMIGDTLEVVNQDSVSHQLGPIWVPPNSTGKLVMEDIGKLAYSCSFATTQYLGLDIRQGTTWGVRLTAIGVAVPTLTALIFVYSIAAAPIQSPEDKKLNKGAA